MAWLFQGKGSKTFPPERGGEDGVGDGKFVLDVVYQMVIEIGEPGFGFDWLWVFIMTVVFWVSGLGAVC